MQGNARQPEDGAQEPPSQDQDPTTGASGQGAATALARLQSQRERRAQQKPADDPTHGSAGRGARCDALH